MTKKELKDYLHYVMQEEQRKYELEKIRKCVYQKKKEWENQGYEYVEEPEVVKAFRQRRSIGEILIAMVGLGFMGYFCGCLLMFGVGLVVLLFKFVFGISGELIEALTTALPFFGAVIGVFIGAFKRDGITKKEARQANEEARRKFDKENEKAKSYNHRLKRNKAYYIPLYEKEYEIITQNYQQVKKNLEKLYNLNVIYPKYRNFVAVCSFYDYICSGKCDSLEGYTGAYVMYDNEVMQRLIIEKLDVIISQLESIKRNQYMLYTQMKEANQNISNMSKQLDNISNNSNISTYHSKITAENTEFMKWFNVFTERKRDKKDDEMHKRI